MNGSKRSQLMQKQITELESKGNTRTQPENKQLWHLFLNYPADTDLYIKNETIKRLEPLFV
jgi:hypothetical protein